VIDRGQLIVTKNLSPAGDERLKIKGQFVLTNLLPPINPLTNGFTIEVIDTQSSQVVLSRFVPAGSPWVANSSATKWTFKDDDNVSGTSITKVIVKDKSSRTPGLFSFIARGKEGNFQLQSENLRLVVTLGGAAQQSANQCGSLTYNNSSGVDPNCELKSGGNTLKCK
jgi:hypothetical protein